MGCLTGHGVWCLTGPTMLNLNETAGATLRLARKRAGLSVRAFAELQGITHSEISRIERGRGTTLEKYAALASGLGLTIHDLFPPAPKSKRAPESGADAITRRRAS